MQEYLDIARYYLAFTYTCTYRRAVWAVLYDAFVFVRVCAGGWQSHEMGGLRGACLQLTYKPACDVAAS